MSDEELLAYAAIHCHTELALFHVNHVRRILALAGVDRDLAGFSGFFPVRPDTMLPLIACARERLTGQLSLFPAEAL